MKLKIFCLSLICAGFFYSLSARAQMSVDRIRQISVFPLHVTSTLNKAAESAWWDLREKLTESKRYMVASKNFMQAKDVFQSRGELRPADVIILGKLLSADAVVTTFVIDHRMSMRVYETKNGLTLWSGDIDMHPSVPLSKQLSETSRKLLYDFMSSVPYHGFVITDSMIGRPTYSEGEKLLFKADIGVGTQVAVGDVAQLVRVVIEKMKPVFQEGSFLEVYAEGKVVAVEQHIITVQVNRRQEGAEIRSEDLVRIPNELKRAREMFGLNESSGEHYLSARAMWGSEGELTPDQKEKKPLVTSLSWIANMALVLLLAF
jgi:hypothetical protein